MKIGGKLLAFVGACSLTTLIVAGVGMATLQSFEQALGTVEMASVRALNAANFNRLAAEVTMDSRGIYASADRADAAKYAAGSMLPPIARTLPNTPRGSGKASPRWTPCVRNGHRV